jgi:subtilisin-like proprotein convertase family protein
MKRNMITLSAVAAALLSGSAMADVFGPGPGVTITDPTTSNSIATSAVITSTLNVVQAGNIASFNSATLTGLTHTWIGDMQVYLTSPAGTRVNLFSRLGNTTATGFGNSNDTSGNYTFTDGGAALGGALGTGPVPAGTYARSTNQTAAVVQVGADGATQGINNNAFSAFNGQSVTGIWTLTIREYGVGDTGTLAGWSFDATIPAPGALALLGLAGLVTGGRRRRA